MTRPISINLPGSQLQEIVDYLSEGFYLTLRLRTSLELPLKLNDTPIKLDPGTLIVIVAMDGAAAVGSVLEPETPEIHQLVVEIPSIIGHYLEAAEIALSGDEQTEPSEDTQ